MELGRILRRSHKLALVFKDAVCISACVFVLAGAPSRPLLLGKIGIHHPMIRYDSATTEQQQKAQ